MPAKEKIGTVVSNKMQQTCIVAVNEKISHKRYGKVITKTKRYAAQDKNFSSQIGDKVLIKQTRPISKTVNWIIIDIVKKSST